MFVSMAAHFVASNQIFSDMHSFWFYLLKKPLGIAQKNRTYYMELVKEDL